MTDLFVATHNRPEYLSRCLSHLFDRTATPFRLHIIDDGSTEGNSEILWRRWQGGDFASLTMKRDANGFARAIDLMETLTESDPVVRFDDDHLCPLVEPDWLARLLAAMDACPDYGIIALNDPSSNTNNRRHVTKEARKRKGIVTECLWAAPFSAIRRKIFANHSLRKARGWPNFDYDASKVWAKAAHDMGYKVGYLTKTYCQHIGQMSARHGENLGAILVEPVDPETLEPPAAYRW